MIPTAPEDRLKDLTRWNRAGLARFQYVDGDAATWLEELRAAMLGLYLKGADPVDRLPDLWRMLFGSELLEPRSDAVEEADRIAALNALRALTETDLAWRDLAAPIPDRKETGRRRNLRLLDQYRADSQDQGWETMRAFARAAHVLLGYVNAYANEGYLRTATQWDNVRRLAAMVNYQPTPPASATTDIALILDVEAGAVEIDRGLAMKYTPPEGGAPLIFETLKPVEAHPDLNAARVYNWNRDERDLVTDTTTHWTVPDKATLAHGDLVVLVDTHTGPAIAMSLLTVKRAEGKGTAEIGFSPAPVGSFTIADTELHAEPAQVLRGLPKTEINVLIAFVVEGLAQYTVGSLVEFKLPGDVKAYGQVADVVNGVVKISASTNVTGTVSMAPMVPVVVEERGSIRFVQSQEETSAVFLASGGFSERTQSGTAIFSNSNETNDSGTVFEGGEVIAYRIAAPDGADTGFFHPTGYNVATILEDAPEVIMGTAAEPTKSVRFPGKPPKGMEAGDWFAARAGSELKALKVDGVRTTADGFYIQFVETPPGTAHEDTEFHGPLIRKLLPVDYNRDTDDAIIAAGATLTGISPEARALIKAGRKVIIDEDRHETRAAEATITTVEDVVIDDDRPGTPAADASIAGVRIGLESKSSLTGWAAGWTAFRLNTVQVSHGETKGSKTLGSGDAELTRQTFAFDVKEISHNPSSAAESGVVPDIDVAVNEVIWPWADYGDVTADGQKAWSAVLLETGGLTLHFRQRLASGANNVRILRHRIGVGAKGTGVPAYSFEKPMKKNRYVKEIIQPFLTSGGSDREPVSAVRDQAPGRLIANGRAVSLRDFEILTARHSSVWQAKARQIVGASAAPGVRIVVVPANGGALATIETDLLKYIRDRALPGTDISLLDYDDLTVEVTANIRVDTAAFDKTDVQAAAVAAVEAAFTLQKRGIGQTLYIAEVMAEIERVTGVETVTIQIFAPTSTALLPKRIDKVGGANAAIVPTGKQVAWVKAVSIVPEAV